jgi:hypothetical protein
MLPKSLKDLLVKLLVKLWVISSTVKINKQKSVMNACVISSVISSVKSLEVIVHKKSCREIVCKIVDAAAVVLINSKIVDNIISKVTERNVNSCECKSIGKIVCKVHVVDNIVGKLVDALGGKVRNRRYNRW